MSEKAVEWCRRGTAKEMRYLLKKSTSQVMRSHDDEHAAKGGLWCMTEVRGVVIPGLDWIARVCGAQNLFGGSRTSGT